jgi:predicted TIM-barrel fold metal-dependent hydrolase
MGSYDREYVPGQIHRSDRMASTGLYEDGKRGIRRLGEEELRLKDQDRDGVQAEVLYGILGSSSRMNDPEAAAEMIRIYNDWLADFCETHPERFAGLACIPSSPIDLAVTEVKRVVKRGAVRGLDVANTLEMPPLYDPYWNPLWDAIDDSGLPLHFHTVGGRMPDAIHKCCRAARGARRSTRHRRHGAPACRASAASDLHVDDPHVARRGGVLSAIRGCAWSSARAASAGSYILDRWTSSGRTSLATGLAALNECRRRQCRPPTSRTASASSSSTSSERTT